jgi:hypothetical protein
MPVELIRHPGPGIPQVTMERSLHSRRISVEVLGEQRLERAQSSFAIRRVPRAAMRTVIGGMVRPRSGDVVLASIARLGQHRKIERPDGRRATLHIGDEILVAYADRYAPDQYESHVPDNLRRTSWWPPAASPRRPFPAASTCDWPPTCCRSA